MLPDNWWLLICGVGVLLMRVGSALHEAGMVRSKNAAGSLIRKVTDLALTLLLFATVGAAIFLGYFPHRPLPSPGAASLLFFFTTCALVATAIPGGITNERSRFWPMAILTLLLAGFIVPLAQRWTFFDFLSRKGMHDLGGAAALHLTGALTGAVASLFVGPRAGKYNRDGSSNAIPGHSVPLASTGILLTTLAWFPYLMGFAFIHQANVAAVALHLLLGLAAGILAAVLFSQLRYGKPDIHLAYAGLLGALVALSACADVDAPWKAILVGAVAGILIPILTLVIDLIWKIDDPTGSIAAHGGGALWGLLAAGLLATPPAGISRPTLLLWQLLGTLAIAALAIAAATATLLLLRLLTPLRSKEADEFDGLDLAEHDIGAYPDFQQTMIKSYHLREA